MRKIAAFLAFCVVFSAVYLYADSVLMLKPDDGKKLMDDYRGLEKNTVDVIAIGSSHVGVNIDPELLWSAYGISEVNLWSGMQPMWISYYFAKEALRYQHPKLLVVDMYRCTDDDDFGEYQYSVKGVQALRSGVDKVKAALAAFEDWKEAAEVLWGMPVYHERYDQLTRGDFEYILKARGTLTDAGIHNVQSVYSLPMPDYTEINGEEPLTEKNEEYLRNLIALAKAHEVKLVLVTIPFMANETAARRANTIARIAEEEGVTYINYLREISRTGVDPATDFYDTGHMNEVGVSKFTRAYAQDLLALQEIPDRREDASFTWFGEGTELASKPVYQMQEQFLGDGTARYTDTGVKLYENTYASWTIEARLLPAAVGKKETYYSCAFLQGGRLHGIVVQQAEDGRLMLAWDDDNFTYFDMPLREDGSFDLALTKHVNTYNIYLNGKLVFDNIVLPASVWEGTLLVGCGTAESGGRTNFGRTQVLNLEVYQEALSASEIAAWSPEALPMPDLPIGFGQEKPELLYELKEQFIGGGQYLQKDHVDTNLKLFADPGTRVTLLTRVVPQAMDGENNVYLSCFAEEANRWRGLLLRGENDTTLSLLLGQVYNLSISCTVGEPLDLCVEKDGNVYTVYVNGEKVCSEVSVDCDPYDGTLLVGCEETLEGSLFRKSATRINSLRIYSGIMDEDMLAAYSWEDAPMPALRTATSVNYQLKNAYMGDGESHAIDTGVQLYDVPDKSWTLDFVIVPNYASYYDVYVSCFREESFAYSGMLVRQEDYGKLLVYLGQLEQIEIPYGENEKRMHFVIVKSGDDYAVYLNGALRGQVTSATTYYDGDLVIGCEQQPDGTFFRYSKVKVLSLTARDGALSEKEALTLSGEQLSGGRFEK